jgi:hypothetical protein
MLPPTGLVTSRLFIALVSAFLLVGCMTLPPRCDGGTQASIHDQLYFGTTRPGGLITADEWAAFVADTITPKLPDGFTVWDASGQWSDPRGRIVREGTHLLSVAHPADARSEQAVLDIAAAYRARFDQQGVFRIRTAVCSGDLEGTR